MLRFAGPIFMVWMMLVIPATAGTNAIVIKLSSASSVVHGGDDVVLDLCLKNTTDAAITHELPLSLPCRIAVNHSIVKQPAKLLGADGPDLIDIPAKGVACRQYRLSIPVYAMDTIQIKLETLEANPIALIATKAPPEAWIGQQVPIDQGQILAQSFLNDLSVNAPMYFLLGVEPGLQQSKFQFSFKYRLFNPDGYIAEKASWVSKFHFGYTQRSIWDLKDDSKPFDDTSYMPELFYLVPKIDLHIRKISAFGIQGGFLHESNGKGGNDSRSTNIVYVKPVMGIHLMRSWYLKIAPNAHVYVNNSNSSNRDLMDYRGYVDMDIGIASPDGAALNSHWWWAKKGPSVQLDFTYPMTGLLGKSLNFYLQAQYFSGYAETLLHFKERHDAIRLGFGIVR